MTAGYHTEDKRWVDLNALVDGELEPQQLADVAALIAEDRAAANAFATLAKLKATTAATRTSRDCRRSQDSSNPWRERTLVGAALVLGVALGTSGGLTLGAINPGGRNEPAMESAALSSASGDIVLGGVRVPNLDTGGLRLERIVRSEEGRPLRVEALYVGDRGCRLRLTVVRDSDDQFTNPSEGARQISRWSVGSMVYVLTGEQMNAARFAAVAQVAKERSSAAGPTKFAEVPRELAALPCLS